jgi:hypothetical protein
VRSGGGRGAKAGGGPETRPQPAVEEVATGAEATSPPPGDAPEVEATIRGALDLGHAAALLREHHPELDQAQRLAAIRAVTRKITAAYLDNPRRQAIAKLALQHRGEPHRDDES